MNTPKEHFMKSKIYAVIYLAVSLTFIPKVFAATHKQSDAQIEQQVTKMTMDILMNEYIFPNIDTPDIDIATHLIFTNNNIVSKRMKAFVEIPQSEAAVIPVYKHDQVNESKVTVTVGAKNHYLLVNFETDGERGYLGEKGTISIVTVKNPTRPEKTTLYPIEVDNSQIGKVYFKIAKIDGDVQFIYEEMTCATAKYEDTICEHDMLRGKKEGDEVTIDERDYEVTNKLKLSKIKFEVTIFSKLKMGDQQHRVYKDRFTTLEGAYNVLTGEYQTELIYNPDLLSRD